MALSHDNCNGPINGSSTLCPQVFGAGRGKLVLSALAEETLRLNDGPDQNLWKMMATEIIMPRVVDEKFAQLPLDGSCGDLALSRERKSIWQLQCFVLTMAFIK